jgi:hypothetical protein
VTFHAAENHAEDAPGHWVIDLGMANLGTANRGMANLGMVDVGMAIA